MMKLVLLTCLVAATSAGFIAPLAYTAPLEYAAPLLTPNNYRGPLSLAPGQPANILGADGRPLDTLEVNLDRSAHITAKALNSGIHILKKRATFIPVIGPAINRVTNLVNAPSRPFTLRYAEARFAPIAFAPYVYGNFY